MNSIINNRVTVKRFRVLFIVFSTTCLRAQDVSNNQSAVNSFTAPDTVCVNKPVTITNTSVGATSYYWNFCVADINATPTADNIGNVGNNFSGPVFIDYAFYNGNYYGFLINYNPGALIRLDFGNSLLNTPTSTILGNFDGTIPPAEGAEGIQIINNEGRWYAIVVGGYTPRGSTPRILKIDFGADLTNPKPVATNWGNIGNMLQPVDLHVFKEGSNWYGFTVNAENNTITRFNFTNSFNNIPTAENLGNIGNLSYPTGIYAINDNGYWRVFIVNGGNNTRTGGAFSLTRLDFGSSLLNIPTGVNLGNPGNMLQHPRDLTIVRSCNQILGFAVNGNPSYNNIVKINFNNDLSATPTITSIGNIGNLDFPHSISKIFRVGADLYSFVPNVANNTVTRLRFPGCTNSSIPNSNLQNPSPISYNAPGIYNINLTIDEGLPTQSSVCKNVVVMAALDHHPVKTLTFCKGDTLLLSSAYSFGNLWNTGSTPSSLYVSAPGLYWVQTSNGSCSNVDSFICKISSAPFQVNLGRDTSICKTDSITLDASNSGATYLWQNGVTTQKLTVNLPGKYSVAVRQNGCIAKDTIVIAQLASPSVIITNDTSICAGADVALGVSGGVKYNWYPAEDLSNSYNSTVIASPAKTTTYYAVVTGANSCVSRDSVTVTVAPKPSFAATATKSIVCAGDSTTLIASGGDTYLWTPAASLSNPDNKKTFAYPSETTTYKVAITNNICNVSDSVFISIRVANRPAYTISKSNDIDCVLSQSKLTATGGIKYLWKPSLGLSNPTISNPVVNINYTTTYSVEITSSEGCVVEESIQVKVLTGNIENGYFVPNSFTPNNDGKNDYFSVRNWGGIKQFSMQIFNRVGQLMFESKSVDSSWDGKFKNVEQPAGAYVYYIKAKSFCGDIRRKGTVILLR